MALAHAEHGLVDRGDVPHARPVHRRHPLPPPPRRHGRRAGRQRRRRCPAPGPGRIGAAGWKATRNPPTPHARPAPSRCRAQSRREPPPRLPGGPRPSRRLREGGAENAPERNAPEQSVLERGARRGRGARPAHLEARVLADGADVRHGRGRPGRAGDFFGISAASSPVCRFDLQVGGRLEVRVPLQRPPRKERRQLGHHPAVRLQHRLPPRPAGRSRRRGERGVGGGAKWAVRRLSGGRAWVARCGGAGP